MFALASNMNSAACNFISFVFFVLLLNTGIVSPHYIFCNLNQCYAPLYLHNSCALVAFKRVRKIAKSDYSFVESVRPRRTNGSPTGRIFMKFELFLKTCREKLSFNKNPTRIKSTLREDVFTHMAVSHWIILKMSNVLDKSCRENKKKHFMFKNFFPPENRAVYGQCRRIWW